VTLTDPFDARRDKDDPAPWQMLATGDRTGGIVSFGEAHVPPHTSGPGLHVHSREDEATYVIAGTMTFVVGGRRFEAGPGTLVWLPREVPHVFANLGDEPVWAFGTITPAGLEGMFKEQAEYFAGLQGPPDPEQIRAIGDKYGVRSLGPPLEV
jgi:mannose-6-phosphate isomerase-like protein (cupin superfamily)